MRPLIADLDIIQTRVDGRRPAFRVEIYDVRSTADTINDIVRGLTLDPGTGPRDFSADTISVNVQERAGDFIESGIAGITIGMVIADPNGQFDPFNTKDDPTGDGRWLRRGNVVRLYEGDERVDPDDWPITFTGTLQGQAGAVTSRNPDAQPNRIQVQAADRSVNFLRYKNTSEKYEVSTSFLSMGTSIATDDMGLDADEIDFSGWGNHLTLQPVQFVDEEPLVSIARLMMLDGFLPKFNGEGILTQTQVLLAGAIDRSYDDGGIIATVNRPFNEIDPTNRVTIVGLDGNLSKAVQPRQEIGRAEITTGFFTQKEDIDIYWSEDRTLLAENIKLSVVKSINGGLTGLGGDEKIVSIPAPNGMEGFQGVRIELESGFAPWLIVILVVIYIVLSWIPDIVITVGFGVTEGFTINVGAAIAALALSAALVIMTRLGRGVYTVEGDPFEYVLAEIREVAEIDGILAADRVEVTIENHLIQWANVAAALARDVLFEQQARGNPRTFTMLHDLRLEPHDTFAFTSDNRSFAIDSLTRTLQRATPTIAQVSAFETTPGLEP